MIHIRKATALDAEAIAPLQALAMTEILYYFIGMEDLKEATRFLKALISSEGNQYSYENIFVACAGEKILGQACLYQGALLAKLRAPVLTSLKERYNRDIETEDETQSGEVYLDTIAVSAMTQGKGVGKILLNHIVDHYVKRKRQTIGLLVDKTNAKAKSLYLKFGFLPVGEKRIFGKVMEHLQLSPSKIIDQTFDGCS